MFAHPNSKRDIMKIGYVQNAPIFGNKAANFEQVKTLVNGQQADLLVLSELFATGYTFTSREEAQSLAESTDGETAKFLKDLSKETGAINSSLSLLTSSGYMFSAFCEIIIEGPLMLS